MFCAYAKIPPLIYEEEWTQSCLRCCAQPHVDRRVSAISPTPILPTSISPSYCHSVSFRLLMQNVTQTMWNNSLVDNYSRSCCWHVAGTGSIFSWTCCFIFSTAILATISTSFGGWLCSSDLLDIISSSLAVTAPLHCLFLAHLQKSHHLFFCW